MRRGAESAKITIMTTRTRSPIEERADRALDRVRPAIAADGGDVWLVRVDGTTAYVQLLGACGGCPASHLTLKHGVEAAIRADVPEIEAVVAL